MPSPSPTSPSPTSPVTDVRFPPEPWQLGGSMDVSVWRVPTAQLPPSVGDALPRGASPVEVGGRAFVGTAFVRYAPGGVLSYDELLAAVLVLDDRRPRITVFDIWVDSPASRAGGRALWGIPKFLAAFARGQTSRTITWRATSEADQGRQAGDTLAELVVRPGRAIPGWRRLPLPMTQRLEGVETVSPAQSLARVRLARHAWHFPAGSPLRFLAEHRPLVSAHLERMSMTFGDADRS